MSEERRRVLMASANGGGGQRINIGIQNTPIPNILNMFYALENGTAMTGEFTLSKAIPNTETMIIDTKLSDINGIFIADESIDARITGNTPENVLFAIVFQPTSDGSGYMAATKISAQMRYNGSTNGKFLTRCSWRVDDGKLYCTGDFSSNENYTPFYSGHTYRWVAW